MADEYTIIAELSDIKAIKRSNNVIVSMNTNTFIENMVEVYGDDAKILQQFSVDFNRLDIYIDDIKYNKIDVAIQRLARLKIRNNGILKRYKKSLMMFLMMMCCQSSFYYSYLFLHKSFLKYDNIYPTSDSINGKRKEVRIYTERKKHPTKEKYCFNYKIKLVSTYLLKNTDKDLDIAYIDTNTILDMNSSTCTITFDVN